LLDVIALLYYSFVQLFNGEYQVPIATPYDIATVKGEGAKLLGVKVLIVLRVRMPTNEVADVNSAIGAVAEHQPHFQAAHVESLCYV
jgi:hypothetical protein